jgi:hypothetical protein
MGAHFFLARCHTLHHIALVMTTQTANGHGASAVRHNHPHLEALRAAGFADVADAIAQDGSSAILDRADAVSHIRRACKFLGDLPQGSTLISTLKRMERRA